MWTRALLKQNAKTAFKRNYWLCVAAALIVAVLSGGFSTNINFDFDEMMTMTNNISLAGIYHYLSILLAIGFISTVVAIVYIIFVGNVMTVGGNRFFLENREHKTSITQIFAGFTGDYMNCVKTLFFRDLYIFLWSLLFVIPGLVKSFSYLMVPYILAENPKLSKDRAITLSRQMMKGHKWEAFVIGLSFVGWYLLSGFTFGILAILYVNPYVQATYAEYYTAIKANAFAKGITDGSELPGVSTPNPTVEPVQDVIDVEADIFEEE